MTGVAALGLLLLAGAPGAGAAARTGGELEAGVVVDPARSVLFVAGVRGGIEAIDSASGQVTWRSSRADRPLGLSGNLLVAQAEPTREGELRIAVLDASANGRTLSETSVELPKEVRAALVDGLGASFRASVSFPDAATALVSWVFTRLPLSAVAAQAGEPRQTRGAARIDLTSGRAEQLGALTEPGLPDAVARLVSSGQLSSPPFRSGDVLFANERLVEGKGERLVVHRWHATTGAALADLEFTGAEDLAAHFGSVDGRYLLVGGRSASTSPDKLYVWFIVSAETGQRVGVFETSLGAARFHFEGSRLVFQAGPSRRRADPDDATEEAAWIDEPLRLRAVDVGTGLELWQYPVRDTAYRGPYPPS